MSGNEFEKIIHETMPSRRLKELDYAIGVLLGDLKAQEDNLVDLQRFHVEQEIDCMNCEGPLWSIGERIKSLKAAIGILQERKP